MKKVIVFLADGFEDCEAVATVDLLRRAGVDVKTASIMENRKVKSAHDIIVMADIMAQDADFAEADMIILPGGGGGTENLKKSELVRQQCLSFAKDKMVAAICAAPTVLGELGILEGKKATCYPGCEEGLKGAEYTQETVTVDENIITGRAPGAAYAFGLELIKILEGEEASEAVRSAIVF